MKYSKLKEKRGNMHDKFRNQEPECKLESDIMYISSNSDASYLAELTTT